MSADAVFRARGTGPAPAQGSLPLSDVSRVLPREVWRCAWRRARLCWQYALPGDLGAWLLTEVDLTAFSCRGVRAAAEGRGVGLSLYSTSDKSSGEVARA